MILIPFQINAREYNVFIALDDQSLERIGAYDPAQVQAQEMGGAFRHLKLKTVLVGYANEEDVQRVLKIIRRDGDPREALQFLSRGFEFRPDDKGDHDGPPLSLKTKPGEQPV
jgi:hypothetical protein